MKIEVNFPQFGELMMLFNTPAWRTVLRALIALAIAAFTASGVCVVLAIAWRIAGF